MQISKAKKFNERMGKRKSLAHGGRVKRQNFAAGGVGAALGTAAQGALSGGAAGIALGPVGAAVGAGIGAIGGFISSLMSGGSPQMPNITDPVTGAQITDAIGRVVASQDQLKGFADALQGANGVQNQSAVFNQLQAVTQGKGPNPAAAMLAESTGKNVANQAAMAAGQRGASANVGLMERENAQQGAATQQQAAGQGATLQATQSLNALNSSGQIAGQQVGETQNALSATNQAATTNQSNLLNAQTAYNNQLTGAQGNVNSSNTSLATAAMPGQNEALKGAVGAVGTAKTALGALGGNGTTGPNNGNNGNPVNSSGQPVSQNLSLPVNEAEGGLIHKPIEGPHVSHLANYLTMSKGGKVPAMVSPGEIYLSPEQAHRVVHDDADPLKIGEKIGGKAKVKGDSLKNDTVPKTLEQGGVVIKRSHTKNPETAKLFVHKSMMKHMKRPGGAK